MAPLISIYSHPRSGTHLLGNYIAQNYYKNVDLSIRPVRWGHWSDRRLKPEGEALGKVYAHHYLPTHPKTNLSKPSIYIYRDGRAVAYSVWKSEGFLNKEQTGITFSEFLRNPLDWEGSPSNKVARPYQTIVEHWLSHVDAWMAQTDDSLLQVQYETLSTKPKTVLNDINKKFGFLHVPKNYTLINKRVGISPNKASPDEWKKHFSKSDLEYFFSIVPNKHPAVVS